MKRIAVVDDEKNIRELIGKYLIKEGYKVKEYSLGDDFLKDFKLGESFDLIVLDIMMEGSDGLDVCKKVREKKDTPIIFVSARSEELDRILGLELGGDDYIAKPFSPRELLVRIKNILKRIEPKKEEDIKVIGNLKIFKEERRILKNGSDLELTNKEFEVLLYFFQNKGVSLSRQQLIENVWGYEYEGFERSVDDIVKRIRKKLTGVPEIEIKTIWGHGYRMEINE